MWRALFVTWICGCSFITVRTIHSPHPYGCTSSPAAPIIDAGITAAAIGVTVASLVVGCEGSDGCGLGAAIATVIGVAATPFPFSSYYGFSRTHRCRDAIDATRARNRDAYRRCVTARSAEVANLAARDAEHAACPVPQDEDEATTREAELDEQAWSITHAAAIAALAGDCTSVFERAVHVQTLSRPRYETIFLAEPHVAACVRAHPSSVHDKCTEDRARLRQEAMRITDLQERGRRLQGLPNCR